MRYFRFLLLALPALIGAHWLLPSDSPLFFLLAVLTIIPLAGYVSLATDHLSYHLGPHTGGLMTATFGNATELIISLFALAAGLIEVVKASIAGSIITNILLVHGAAILVGGLRHGRQHFSRHVAVLNSTVLLIALVGYLIPTLFIRWGSNGTEAFRFSLGMAVIFLATYLLELLYLQGDAQIPGDDQQEDHHLDQEQVWPLRRALAVLVLSTAAVVYAGESLVSSIEPAMEALGWSKTFIGLVIIPIISNAGEVGTAVMMALNDKMDAVTEVTIGSSIQIALMTASVLVLSSPLFGEPLVLIFHPSYFMALFAAVLVTNSISRDGETTWLEGALSVSIYLVLALAFYVMDPLA